jgi:hypothetical protein
MENNAYDKIINYFEDIQDEVYERNIGQMGDLMLNFNTSYTNSGIKIKTNVLQLNMPQNCECFYFISVPDNDMSDFSDIVDQYPIYFADLKSLKIEKIEDNFRDFMSTWFPGDWRLEQFSTLIHQQQMPICLFATQNRNNID